jgi:hypothetical protein
VSSADFLRRRNAKLPLRRRRSFSQFMCWDAELPADLVEKMWRDPQALLAESARLQHKLRCSVAKLDHSAGPFVWKHHNWGTVYRSVKRSLSPSPAAKSWADARFLFQAGVPTPRPRAYLEHRIGPFKRSSYLLSDYIPGTSLYRFLRFERPTVEFLRSLAEQVAAIWQQLDDLCVWHNDFKTENLLVDTQGKVWLIDFERMRRIRNRDRLRRRQLRDVHDFFHPRNWRENPAAAEIFRGEFVKTQAVRDSLVGPRGAKHPLFGPRPKSNRSSQLISVLIPCRNAAESIEACVESARDMADEILIADAGSTDGTMSIVQSLEGCRVIQRPCNDEIAFANWADTHASHPWIFRLLPSEQLTAELGRQIQDAAAKEPTADGFRISRKPFFHGRLLKHGGFCSNSSIRLYRKHAARHERRDGEVEVILQDRNVGQLPSHLTWEMCFHLEHTWHEVFSSATRAARASHAEGRHAIRRNAVGRAAWQFVRSYLLRWGWLDGWPGLHATVLSAVAIYFREALLWELRQPIGVRPVVVRDRWQGLKLFDPSDAAETAASEVLPRSADVALEFPDSEAARELRPAA